MRFDLGRWSGGDSLSKLEMGESIRHGEQGQGGRGPQLLGESKATVASRGSSP